MNWLIKKLGGFTKDEILNETIGDLFNTISDKDILRVENNTWLYRDKPLTDSEMKLISAEAKYLLSSTLWKILQDDIKWQANEKMYFKSKTIEDLTAGKLWLYTLNCIKKRLEELK
ncbi:hypothetical protein M0Q03_02195 [bacterium]|jgi:hypothetical protein|nr:hypothetical protein [bacterium]